MITRESLSHPSDCATYATASLIQSPGGIKLPSISSQSHQIWHEPRTVIACVRFPNHLLSSPLRILYALSQLQPLRLVRRLSRGNPSAHTSAFRNRPPPVPATTLAFHRPLVLQPYIHMQSAQTRKCFHLRFPPSSPLSTLPSGVSLTITVRLSLSTCLPRNRVRG